MAKVLPSGQARAASAPLNFSFHSGDSVAARNAAAEDRRNCVSSLARASAAVPPNQAAPQPPAGPHPLHPSCVCKPYLGSVCLELGMEMGAE